MIGISQILATQVEEPPSYLKLEFSFSFKSLLFFVIRFTLILTYYRMKLCCLLPKVKSTLKIPGDKHLLQQLEMCVRKLLCQEKDKDVLAIVKRVSIPSACIVYCNSTSSTLA